jgi:hypothetical protein
MVMLSHGLVSGALFLCVGVIYDRLHTREIERYGGLSDNMPAYAVLFLLFTMASVGLPGTGGFVGEFLALMGAYKANTWVALVATTGIILGAAYMLYLYWRVAYGKLVKPDVAAMPDLNGRELAMLGTIAAVVLWMGIYPKASSRRCARMSAPCWPASSAFSRPAMRRWSARPLRRLPKRTATCRKRRPETIDGQFARAHPARHRPDARRLVPDDGGGLSGRPGFAPRHLARNRLPRRCRLAAAGLLPPGRRRL